MRLSSVKRTLEPTQNAADSPTQVMVAGNHENDNAMTSQVFTGGCAGRARSVRWWAGRRTRRPPSSPRLRILTHAERLVGQRYAAMGSNSSDVRWFSFDVPYVHFVVVTTEPYNTPQQWHLALLQWRWLNDDLAKVRRQGPTHGRRSSSGGWT